MRPEREQVSNEAEIAIEPLLNRKPLPADVRPIFKAFERLCQADFEAGRMTFQMA